MHRPSAARLDCLISTGARLRDGGHGEKYIEVSADNLEASDFMVQVVTSLSAALKHMAMSAC